jgi:hypothetical protein
MADPIEQAVSDARRDLNTMVRLVKFGTLDPTTFEALAGRIARQLDVIDRSVQGRPDIFGVTDRSSLRWVKHLAVMDGDRP